MTKKYRVVGVMTATVFIGEYEAESEDEAEEMANEDAESDWYPSLCHQCGNEIDLSDIYEVDVSEVGV